VLVYVVEDSDNSRSSSSSSSIKGKFVRYIFIQKYIRRASCSTLTQTASSWGYVWTAPGCSHYECSREDRSKLRVRQCGSCGCRSELSVRGGRQGRRDQQTAVVIVPPQCAHITHADTSDIGRGDSRMSSAQF